MKLASYKDGSRDGHLVVVSRDLATAHYATAIATRLQQVLDDWSFLSPQLEDLYTTLNQGKARHAFAFEPAKCMAPLPRAYQWAEGPAFMNHLERVHKARGTEVPARFHTDPPMTRGGSDDFLGPTDPIVCTDEAWGFDFGAGVAVVTGDVAMGASPEAALEGVRLLMLANDVSLRNLITDQGAAGCGSIPGKPATAFSPVAATPDELGAAWRGGRVHLNLEVVWNGKRFGLCDAGPEMTFHFGQLIAHLAKTRNVRAGSIVGSGAVSNQDGSRGCSCIAEQRAVETIESGTPKTAFLRHGNSIRIEMKGTDATSVFGAITQQVAAPG